MHGLELGSELHAASDLLVDASRPRRVVALLGVLQEADHSITLVDPCMDLAGLDHPEGRCWQSIGEIQASKTEEFL